MQCSPQDYHPPSGVPLGVSNLSSGHVCVVPAIFLYHQAIFFSYVLMIIMPYRVDIPRSAHILFKIKPVAFQPPTDNSHLH